MKAIKTPSYGAAEVLEIHEVPTPTIGDHEVLVEVLATAVTAGDLRLRAADFPGISSVLGRLMIGLARPKHPIQGTMFAGRVAAVGVAVTRYAVGDDVFGSADHGTYAEYLAVAQDGPMAKMPGDRGLVDYDEAAAVPYGAWTALHFLRDLGAVQPGEAVLIVGASGGVGRFAVQLAKHMGAEVTGVCSSKNFELVRELGADHLIDYASEDFHANGRRYDLIFDIAGASGFRRCRSSLTRGGRYLTLLISAAILGQMAWTSMVPGPRAIFSVALGDRDAMDELRELLERGVISPVIARRFPIASIAEAHIAAETGRLPGAVVVRAQREASRLT